MLSIGVVFAVKADLGVSPVSSLSYALALVSGMSIGLATFVSNFLYLFIQFIITRKIDFKNYIIQLFAVGLLSIFIDISMQLANYLPSNDSWIARILYLVISLFIIAGSIFLLLNTKLPLMPYDSLVPLLYNKYNWPIGRTRMTCDILNVSAAAIFCLVFLQTLGSVGIGTVVSAIFIGKILGIIMRKYGQPFSIWLFK